MGRGGAGEGCGGGIWMGWGTYFGDKYQKMGLGVWGPNLGMGLSKFFRGFGFWGGFLGPG